MRNTLVNLLLIIGKVLAPVIKVVVKMAKMAKVIKVALIAGNFAAYAYMFSWQFSAVILVFLFVHEYGHLWAMKYKGMKTKGMYFIPFLGAAAVTDSEFKSYEDEVFVALMGPVWGIGLALLSCILYRVTGQILFAGAATWMFLVTIFNLFPIMPLDGGRVTRCVAMSLTSWGGAVMFCLSIVLMVFLVKFLGLGLIVFFLIVGGVEVIVEILSLINKRKKIKDIENILQDNVVTIMKPESIYVSPFEGTSELVERIKKIDHPVQLDGYTRTIVQRKLDTLKNGTKKPMSFKGILVSITAILLIAGPCIVIMQELKHIPGSEMALDILKDKKEVKK